MPFSHASVLSLNMYFPDVQSGQPAVPSVYHAHLAHQGPSNFACSPTRNSFCMCLLHITCCVHGMQCLLQATGAGELRPLSNRHLGPLGFTSHEQQAHPQTSVLSLPQPPPPRPHPLVFGQPSAIQAVSRTDSLGSVASSASLGPRTPFGRQNASNPYQPHLQPAQVQVVSQTAEGRGTTLYYTGIDDTDLAQPNMSVKHVVQPLSGSAGDHVKALVGEVVKVDSSTGDDTHKIFSRVCLSNGWRFYLDVRGE